MQAELTVEQLAVAIARTPRRVRQLTEAGVFTRVPSKHPKRAGDLVYAVPDCLQQWIRYQLEKLSPKASGGSEDRKAAADAEFAELRVRKLRAEVIDATGVRSEVRAAFGRVRTRLLATPGEFAPQMLDITHVGDATDRLRALVEVVLPELQAAGSVGALLDDSNDDDESAAA